MYVDFFFPAHLAFISPRFFFFFCCFFFNGDIVNSFVGQSIGDRDIVNSSVGPSDHNTISS